MQPQVSTDVVYKMTEASDSIRLKAKSLSEGLHDNERLSTVVMLLKWRRPNTHFTPRFTPVVRAKVKADPVNYLSLMQVIFGNNCPTLLSSLLIVSVFSRLHSKLLEGLKKRHRILDLFDVGYYDKHFWNSFLCRSERTFANRSHL